MMRSFEAQSSDFIPFKFLLDPRIAGMAQSTTQPGLSRRIKANRRPSLLCDAPFKNSNDHSHGFEGCKKM